MPAGNLRVHCEISVSECWYTPDIEEANSGVQTLERCNPDAGMTQWAVQVHNATPVRSPERLGLRHR
jgi:hypothetical protein